MDPQGFILRIGNLRLRYAEGSFLLDCSGGVVVVVDLRKNLRQDVRLVMLEGSLNFDEGE